METLTVVAELADLKANTNRYAYGSVVEGKLDKGRGAVATLLVENGTLRASDPIVVGAAYGRVRQMLDDKGRVIKEALPYAYLFGLAFKSANSATTVNVSNNSSIPIFFLAEISQ